MVTTMTEKLDGDVCDGIAQVLRDLADEIESEETFGSFSKINKTRRMSTCTIECTRRTWDITVNTPRYDAYIDIEDKG